MSSYIERYRFLRDFEVNVDDKLLKKERCSHHDEYIFENDLLAFQVVSIF
jgi:hypothetical protein